MKALLVALVVIVVAACVPVSRAEGIDTKACSKLANTYFRKPLKQTISEFTARDLESQYMIYICGNQYIHPPALHLAAPFASEGKPAALFLEQKLSAASSPSSIRDILNVYAEMQRQKTYDVKSNASLIQLLDTKISTIADSYWRDHCQGILNTIKGS